VLLIRDILERIQIIPHLKQTDLDPAIFVSDLQDSHYKLTFSKFFAYYFLKLHLHHSSKLRSHEGVTKQQELRFLSLFLLDEEGSGAGTGSVTHTNGSGWPKNIRILWIRIRLRIRNTGCASALTLLRIRNTTVHNTMSRP
jgi:hypothetical protein